MSTITIDQLMKVTLWPSIGFGEEHRIITKKLDQAKNDLLISNSIGNTLREVQDELSSIYNDCNKNNWDGYDAIAISPETIDIAERFAECFLLLELPVPDLIPEPTGAIAFEWEKSTYQSLIVSINNYGEIAYAGIFGSNRAKGIERFTNSIPEAIMKNLKRLYSTLDAD